MVELILVINQVRCVLEKLNATHVNQAGLHQSFMLSEQEGRLCHKPLTILELTISASHSSIQVI